MKKKTFMAHVRVDTAESGNMAVGITINGKMRRVYPESNSVKDIREAQKKLWHTYKDGRFGPKSNVKSNVKSNTKTFVSSATV